MDMLIMLDSIKNALVISIFVFVMMVLVDYFNVLSRGRMNKAIKGGRFRQYSIASFLGATPGCLGAFTNVSFYVHGLISFGALVGGMVATSGDEAFVMLTMFPGQALLLFLILFVLGIVLAWVADKAAAFLKINLCQDCRLTSLHEGDAKDACFDKNAMKKPSLVRIMMLLLVIAFLVLVITGALGEEVVGWKKITFIVLLSITLFIFATVSHHYLKDHIWKHIAKKHLWKIFLWSLFALLFISIGLKYWNIESFVRSHMFWVLVIACLIALIPESGPHLVFVVLFAQGLVPFSVLLASSIVQDGHGMLPLLSYSVKDSVWVKMFNLFFGLLIGGGLYMLGM